jgi:hypothetical protein
MEMKMYEIKFFLVHVLAVKLKYLLLRKEYRPRMFANVAEEK